MTINPKLLEPTLLWENPNPNSSFSAQNLVLSQNSQNFKYLVLRYKLYMGAKINGKDGELNRGAEFMQKVDNTIGNGYLIGAESNQAYRVLGVTSYTVVSLSNTTSSFEAPNQLIIPIDLYGTNIL